MKETINGIKIYINDENEKIPEDETCYIVGKQGIFLKKKLDLIESLTPVDKISFLNEISSFAKINIPKIPTKMFSSIVAFFKEVYDLYQSEAVVLIYYNKEKKLYKIFVPEQEVSAGSLKYELTKSIPEFILVGSVHSHGSGGAFHSTTDKNDEQGFDGIHFTVGNVDEDFFDICGSIVSNGFRSKISCIDYIEELNQVNDKFYIGDFNEKLTFNKKWLEKVKEIKVFRQEINYDRYVWENGKLIYPYSEYYNRTFNNHNNKNNYLINTPEKSHCKTCLWRNEKLKLSKKDKKNKNLQNNECFDGPYYLSLFDEKT